MRFNTSGILLIEDWPQRETPIAPATTPHYQAVLPVQGGRRPFALDRGDGAMALETRATARAEQVLRESASARDSLCIRCARHLARFLPALVGAHRVDLAQHFLEHDVVREMHHLEPLDQRVTLLAIDL